jgi:hypothetical protein
MIKRTGERSTQVADFEGEKRGTRRGSDETKELIDRFVRDVPKELVICLKGNRFLGVHVEVADARGCNTGEAGRTIGVGIVIRSPKWNSGSAPET